MKMLAALPGASSSAMQRRWYQLSGDLGSDCLARHQNYTWPLVFAPCLQSLTPIFLRESTQPVIHRIAWPGLRHSIQARETQMYNPLFIEVVVSTWIMAVVSLRGSDELCSVRTMDNLPSSLQVGNMFWWYLPKYACLFGGPKIKKTWFLETCLSCSCFFLNILFCFRSKALSFVRIHRF